MSQLIYGIHPVIEVLKASPKKIEKIFISSHNQSKSIKTIIEMAQKNLISVKFTTKDFLDSLTQGGIHQNVAASIEELSYIGLEELLNLWKKGQSKALFLILDCIQDPNNFGSIIRTALGCGVHGIIIPKDRAVGITSGVIKSSSGASAYLPIARVVNLASTIDILKKHGIWVYGASSEAEELIYQIDFTIDVAIVIGSEAKGIRPLIKKKCDRIFSIPMKGQISSFNASVSGGMILYEVIRQRNLSERG